MAQDREGAPEGDPTLRIVLEDVGGTSWWAGLLTTVTAQSGSAQLRFVAVSDGERVYRGPAFTVPRTVGPPVAPEEAWAPGMGESLRELQQVVERDGWVEVGRGEEPWSFRYRRSAPGVT